jgi:SAM-dependent methyltransferase
MSGVSVRLAYADGAVVEGSLWAEPVDAVDRRVLALVRGPVLDIGCGPARHTVALLEAGVMAMGIDITPPALHLARVAGAAVLARDVFDRIPATGRWGTALLLDGNLGIGGNPVALLTRVRELLAPGGQVLGELVADGPARGAAVRLSVGEVPGPWFAWRPVGRSDIGPLAAAAALTLVGRWTDEGRHFCLLER